jgi:hypothetical protein
MKRIRYCWLRESVFPQPINQPEFPLCFSMPQLPTTLWGFYSVGGAVCLFIGGLVFRSIVYAIKKVVDVAAEVVKAKLLKEHPKQVIAIYGPDGRIARRIELDS